MIKILVQYMINMVYDLRIMLESRYFDSLQYREDCLSM